MKKRIIKFVSLAVIVDFALDTLCNLLRINIPFFSESVTASNTLGLCVSATSLVLRFFLGYNLSKDKTSAIVFSGTMYFAYYLPNVVSAFVSSLLSYFSSSADMTPILTVAETVSGVVLLPLEIFIGIYAYTAFVGINEKLSPKGMSDFTMSLPKARKRLILAFVVQTVVGSLITSIPMFFTLLSDEEISGFSVKLFAWLSSAVILFIIYYTGYKPGKNHTEAMAFFSAYALGGGISSLISALFSVTVAPVISKVLTSGIGGETMQEVLTEMFTVIDVDTFSLAASSPILLISSVVVTLYVFKFFFENKNKEFYAQ